MCFEKINFNMEFKIILVFVLFTNITHKIDICCKSTKTQKKQQHGPKIQYNNN